MSTLARSSTQPPAQGNKAEHLPPSIAEVVDGEVESVELYIHSAYAFKVYTGTVLPLPLTLQFSEIQFGNTPHQFRIWWEDEGLNAPPKCLLCNLVQQSRSHTILYHIQPGLPRVYRDYPKITESSPTCGRDDMALRFPPLRLLCYFHPISLVYVSGPKALVI